LFFSQQVGILIEPAAADVTEFLRQHMLCDLETIHAAVGRSVDDVLVLAHIILVQAVNITNLRKEHFLCSVLVQDILKRPSLMQVFLVNGLKWTLFACQC
jgi:hypothetical protein